MDIITTMELKDFADIVTIVGIILGIGTLVYTAKQIRMSARISKGQFFLELEKMSSLYDDVHLKLRGGEWSEANKGPSNHEDWSKLEDYMGFFEYCEILIRDSLIDIDTFEKIFGYRIRNIISNEIIYNAKLIKERNEWILFISLLKRLNIEESFDESLQAQVKSRSEEFKS